MIQVIILIIFIFYIRNIYINYYIYYLLDINTSNLKVGPTFPKRIYFTNYDIEHFMKPIRTASQGDILTENYQILSQKIDSIDLKLDKIIEEMKKKVN